MQLKILKEIPKGLENVRSEELYKIIEEPCLLEIDNGSDQWVFLSVMLHGNEPAGLKVLQKLIKKYQSQMPRSVLVLFGNVCAARDRLRFRHDQPDFNRIWNGGNEKHEQWASDVLDYVFSKDPLWGLDLHNNTGKNPLYACINHLHDDLFRLAGAFSDKVVYFETPEEALGVALSKKMPAITLECGHFADIEGVETSFRYVDRLLGVESIDEIPYNPRFKLYEVEAVVRVRRSLDIYVGTGAIENSVSFLPHLEDLNFEEAKAGSVIGRSTEPTTPLTVEGVNGDCLHKEFIEYRRGDLVLTRDVVPSMISLNPDIIRQDCLGYFMAEKGLK